MDETEISLAATLKRAARLAPSPSGVLPSNERTHLKGTPRKSVILTVMATVLVIGLAAGGAATFGSRVSESSSPSSAASASYGSPRTTAPASPPALIGQDERVATLGAAAFPLPRGWSLNDNACGQPHSNTVSTFEYGSGPSALCTLGRAKGVSEIQLWHMNDPQQRHNVRAATSAITLDDGTNGRVTEYLSASPAGYTTVVLVVPDRHIVLLGDGPSPEVLRHAMVRITSIPSDRTVVPALGGETPDSARTVLRAIDLRLKIVPTQYGHRSGSIRWQRPVQGLAVLRGSAVTIGVDR